MLSNLAADEYRRNLDDKAERGLNCCGSRLGNHLPSCENREELHPHDNCLESDDEIGEVAPRVKIAPAPERPTCVYADADGICYEPRAPISTATLGGTEPYCRKHRREVWGY